jgi:hypothetical protein
MFESNMYVHNDVDHSGGGYDFDRTLLSDLEGDFEGVAKNKRMEKLESMKNLILDEFTNNNNIEYGVGESMRNALAAIEAAQSVLEEYWNRMNF